MIVKSGFAEDAERLKKSVIEEARRLAKTTGKATEWQVKIQDFSVEHLVKNLTKKAKLKVRKL